MLAGDHEETEFEAEVASPGTVPLGLALVFLGMLMFSYGLR